MPTKRNNNEVKEFAIGTKIEYNGKLYEVVKQESCDICSLKHICPNNDIVKNNNVDNLLSRDKRLSIFGECSSIVRSDGKSVVFKEIHEDIPVIANDKVKPLYAGNNKSQLRPIKFEIPKGFIIDTENSDLSEGIIRFKRNWLSIQEIYKALYDRGEVTYRENLKDFSNIKMLAIANIMDIARYFNNDWYYKVNSGECGYSIAYDNSAKEPYYTVCKENPVTDVYFGNIVFKNETDAQYVIDNPNFKDILDKIFKV